MGRDTPESARPRSAHAPSPADVRFAEWVVVRLADGLSCERAGDPMRGGPKSLDAAGLDRAITREDFSGAVVRITRECTGSNGRRVGYPTPS